jgi:type IV secretory pathway TrbF-like protein
MNLLRKREVRSPEVSAPHSPYLAARREWDERYGDLITRARNWRTMAALSCRRRRKRVPVWRSRGSQVWGYALASGGPQKEEGS